MKMWIYLNIIRSVIDSNNTSLSLALLDFSFLIETKNFIIGFNYLGVIFYSKSTTSKSLIAGLYN